MQKQSRKTHTTAACHYIKEENTNAKTKPENTHNSSSNSISKRRYTPWLEGAEMLSSFCETIFNLI
jgi:hypothetical protein